MSQCMCIVVCMDVFFSAMDNTWDQIDDGTQYGFTTTSIQQFSQYLGTQMSGQQHQPLFEDEVICRVICVFLIEEPIKIDSYVYIHDRKLILTYIFVTGYTESDS